MAKIQVGGICKPRNKKKGINMQIILCIWSQAFGPVW